MMILFLQSTSIWKKKPGKQLVGVRINIEERFGSETYSLDASTSTISSLSSSYLSELL